MATDNDSPQPFAAHGDVSDCVIITDRETGRSRGFGFVEMDNAEEAESAIERLNGSDLQRRPLTVNEARPQKERSRGPRRDEGNRDW